MAGDASQDPARQAPDVVVVPMSDAKAAPYGFLDVPKSILTLSIFAL